MTNSIENVIYTNILKNSLPVPWDSEFLGDFGGPGESVAGNQTARLGVQLGYEFFQGLLEQGGGCEEECEVVRGSEGIHVLDFFRQARFGAREVERDKADIEAGSGSSVDEGLETSGV